jgi:hypothetical protein
MQYRRKQIVNKCLVVFCSGLFSFLLAPATSSQTKEHKPRLVAVSAQMEKGMLIYRLNGKRVEDTPKNSLITNLSRILAASGGEATVFVIIDVRAPFSEVGKLDTALDKVGMAQRRIFVTDFRQGVMNEIHWDKSAIPIPGETQPE